MSKICTGVSEANLFDHIRSMLYTTGPAFLISLVIYFIIGFQFKGGDVDTTAVNTILGGLQKSFKIVSAQVMS